MKTLHIVRHGKSSWDLPGVADIDRPLLEKGVQNNYHMAERLKNNFEIPDLIISSPANRAIHTAIILARAIGLSLGCIQINEHIYESTPATIIDMILEIPENIKSLLIVGHNPTFTDLANLFLLNKIDNLPTSGIVSLQFQTKNWKIINTMPVFSKIDYPKNN